MFYIVEMICLCDEYDIWCCAHIICDRFLCGNMTYVAKVICDQDHFLCGEDPFLWGHDPLKLLERIIIKEHSNQYHICKTAGYVYIAMLVVQQV